MSRLHSPEAQALAEIAALAAEGARLSRGRQYQRKGNVSGVEVRPALVSAFVHGSGAEPYDVFIACREASGNVRDAAASDIAAAVPKAADVAFSCGCPDWGDPCKHGIAALLEFAREVDDDPRLLLVWRGIEDLTPPPPPGTESLVPTPPPTPAERPGVNIEVSDPAPVGSRDDPAGESDREVEVEDPQPDLGDGELDGFFRGAVPDEAGQLVGPLEEVQLDAYGRARIVLENLDVAPVFADAMDAIADHWLAR